MTHTRSKYALLVAMVLICPLSLRIAIAQETPKTSESGQNADELLSALSSYVKLKDVSDATKDLAAAETKLKSAKPTDADYQQKLEDYTLARDKLKSIVSARIESVIKSTSDKDLDPLWHIINWDHEAFAQCLRYTPEAFSAGEQPAQSLRDDLGRCREKFKQTIKNLGDYDARLNSEMVQRDQEIAALEDKISKEKDEKEKKKLEADRDALRTRQKDDESKRKQVHQLQKSLDLGELLSGIGQIVLGIVEGIACFESGEPDSCIGSVTAIVQGINSIKDATNGDGGTEEITVPENRPADVVNKENAIKAAYDQPSNANKMSPASFEQANANLRLIPTQESGNLAVAEKQVGDSIVELDIVTADKGVPILTISDQNLYTEQENKSLALLSGFKAFTGASTLKSDDGALLELEIRGSRKDGRTGSILVQVFPLDSTGKVVAYGE